MKKQKLLFNYLLLKYNKYRAKLNRFQLTGRNKHRQGVLKKHIDRLQDKLYSLYNSINLRKATGVAMLTASMMLITPDAEAQFNSTPQTNPFNLAYTSDESSAVLVDIDGDGDLDFFSGSGSGDYYFFENTGSLSAPSFDAAVINPFNLTDITYETMPGFGDIDGDGDFDMITGSGNGNFYYYENTGSATTPSFDMAVTNAFNLTDVYFDSNVSLVDIDNDGDLDLFSGNYYGDFYYFENIGTASVPNFSTYQLNPFNLTSLNYRSSTGFVDFDSDGDLDLFSGSYYGEFYYYENIGTVSAPSFGSRQFNPFNLTSLYYSNVAIADIDNDGDLDLFSGHYNGDYYLFENISNKWTGATNTDWATASNWSLNTVPLSSDFAIIPDVSSASGNFPVIAAVTTIGNVMITSGASLTVNTGITLDGTITNNGTVTLKDGAYLDDFTNASVFFVGNITIETVAANGVSNDQRLISSPVSNPAFSEIADDLNGPSGAGAQGTNGVAITVDDCATPTLTSASNYGNLFEFDESLVSTCSLDGWVVRSSGNLENGRGYSAYLPSGSTFDFTGTPNFGQINQNLTKGTSGVADGEGWNLIGNPYPSPIKRDDIITAGASDVQYFVTTGIYQGSYVAYTPTSNIAIAQGFQVHIDSINSFVGCVNSPINTILADFNTFKDSITNIPNPFNFNLDNDATASYIIDGGGDMYDRGNFLNTNLGTAIPYTDGVISTSTAFGGGSYFTVKDENLFAMVADLNGVSSFEITGDTGAEGDGLVSGFQSTITIDCKPFDIFVKQISNADDPSINHIFIVPSSTSIAQTYSTNSANDLHTLTGLINSDRLYYLLVAGDDNIDSGYLYTQTEINNIVSNFLTYSNVTESFEGISFTDAMRTTNAATWYQNDNWYEHKLEVSVFGANYADKTTLFFNNEATNGYEAMYDVSKRKSLAGHPSLSTFGAGKDLTLNGLSVNDLGETIPMNLDAGANGSFTLSFEGKETFPANTTIYVKDLQENLMHNIADGDYTFTANTADNTERFEIVFIPELDFIATKVDCELNDGGLVLENMNHVSNRTFEVLANNTIINSGNLADLSTVSLAAGDYTLEVADAFGGSQSYDIRIETANAMEASLSISSTEIQVGEVISLNNTTSNANTVVWTINNETIAAVNNLSYSFEEAGVYEVVMSVSNDECSDIKTEMIKVVNKSTGINDVLNNNLTIHPNPINDYLKIDFDGVITLEIVNTVGQKVLLSTEKEVNTSALKSGIYFVYIYNDAKELLSVNKVIKK